MKLPRFCRVLRSILKRILDIPRVSALFATVMILPASSSSRSRNRGFTLLEIMVVLAILGLLVAVLVRNVGGDLDRGQEQAAGLFVKTTLTSPLTSFRIDTGNYPTTAQGLDALVAEPQGVRGWRGPYVEKLPMDPWQQPYEYRFPGTKNKSSFDLFSKGRDQTVGTDDDIGNW